MLFNSFEFLVFFPVVVGVYLLTPQRYRWTWLLAASYYFYMCWKAEYLVLILISTLIDYVAGLRMGRTEAVRERRFWLVTSLLANLGILFAFKYANFFGESLSAVFDQFNIMLDVPVFNVLLPVGISFYTFQSMSYTIDVYRGEKTPERHLGYFALYVAFFPQLVAGPIERSTRLLPNLRHRAPLTTDRLVSGLQLMLWGFFKKLVIADRVAIYVNEMYGAPWEQDGLTLLVATYFFAFQIYCDFSGYSDIAIGTARILGVDLMKNFDRPYFATSIGEFWHRWHISLSTWFRDYLYIPLGGNRVRVRRWYFNLMATFVISGLWHGANWTFVVWGFLHGGLLVAAVATAGWRKRFWERIGANAWPRLMHGMRLLLTFHLVCLAWVFFRAENVGEAVLIVLRILTMNLGAVDFGDLAGPLGWGELAVAIGAIGLMLAVHIQQGRQPLGNWIRQRPALLRWAVYYALLFGIVFFGVFNHSEFIYFQF